MLLSCYFHATFIHDLPPMQCIFSTLLKGAKVLKSAGTVSDKFNSLGHTPHVIPVTNCLDIVENVLQAIYVLPAASREIRLGTPKRPK